MKHRRMRVAIAINLLMAEGIFIATLVVIVKVWILKLSSSGPEAISTAIGTLLIEACEALIVPLQEVVSSSFCFCICHLLLSLLPLLQLLSTNPFPASCTFGQCQRPCSMPVSVCPHSGQASACAAPMLRSFCWSHAAPEPR